jgi:hypothetical protein
VDSVAEVRGSALLWWVGVGVGLGVCPVLTWLLLRGGRSIGLATLDRHPTWIVAGALAAAAVVAATGVQSTEWLMYGAGVALVSTFSAMALTGVIGSLRRSPGG